MAAGLGEYRVQITYDSTQCDISCDMPFDIYISNAYFSPSNAPAVTYTFSAKEGYVISDITVDGCYDCTYEIVGENKIKITPSNGVVSGYLSGEVYIIVTTREDIKKLSTLFTMIAEAIRGKSGETADIPAVEFPARIRALPAGTELVPATLTIGTQQSISGISLFAGAPDSGDSGGTSVSIEYRCFDFDTKTYKSEKSGVDVHKKAVQLRTAIGSLFYINATKTPIQISGLELVSNVTIGADSPVYIVTSNNVAIVYPNP